MNMGLKFTSQSTTAVHKFPEFSLKRLSTRRLPSQKKMGTSTHAKSLILIGN